MREALKVGVSGVRGVVGDSLTPPVVMGFVQAFGTFVGRGPVAVGRDTRPSGEALERAVAAGLISVGCRPVLLGTVPTPSLLYRAATQGVRGAVAITASHNPAEWNALKFADRTGIFLDRQKTEELLDIYHQGEFPLVPENELPVEEHDSTAVAQHFDRVCAVIDRDAILRQRFRVAVDCVNGVGALHAGALLEERLGCEVIWLHNDPTRVFERPPEPLPRNLRRLCQAVRRHKCRVGFALDPDGDRLAIVDEKGRPLGEDLSLALEVDQVLSSHRRGDVAVNFTTSRAIEHIARKHGCQVHRAPTGEVNVVQEMMKSNAVVGGENTGGFIFPDVHLCRDAFSAMAIVLEFLALSGESIAEWRAHLPRFYLRRASIPCPTERAPGVLLQIRRRFRDQSSDTRDGVYLSGEGLWLHVRRSNTEPVIRLAVEGEDPAAVRALFEEVKRLVQEQLAGISARR